jgi:hypothetical protein
MELHDMLRAQGELTAVEEFTAKLKGIYASIQGEKDG